MFAVLIYELGREWNSRVFDRKSRSHEDLVYNIQTLLCIRVRENRKVCYMIIYDDVDTRTSRIVTR